MRLIILPILFFLSLFLLLDREEENRIKSMTIGDLIFTLDTKTLGKPWVSKEKNYLSFDLSLPDLSPYQREKHGKNKVRINVKVVGENYITTTDRLANTQSNFGATFNANSPYSDLDYYSTADKYNFEYFYMEAQDDLLMAKCDKIKEPYSPQCHISYISLSDQVIAKYFYPRTFLSDWKVIHSKIRLLLYNSINKEI